MQIGGFNKNLASHSNSLNSVNEKLSSGKRINSAADDAAGLQIAARLLAQNNEFLQGIQNANDGVSVAQIADTALSGVDESLNRLRELSLQAGSGILTADDRQALQTEANEIVAGINDTIGNTNFGGIGLLNQNTNLDIQTGDSATTSFQLQDTGSQLNGFGINTIDLTNPAGAGAAINSIDQSLGAINDSRAGFGATQNRLESNIRNLAQTFENSEAARARIEDADFAALASQQAQSQIQQQGSASILAQSNAQQGQILNFL